MKKSNRFLPEVRERAVRMVREHRGDYLSLWAAIESIAQEKQCKFRANNYTKQGQVQMECVW